MSSGTLKEVTALYSAYPYPTPAVGEMLITDLSNAIQHIAEREYYLGKSILDAGCGTGHRAVSIAKSLPGTQVVGIDVTESSLEIACRLAQYHNVRNLNFRKHDLTIPNNQTFDIVVSTGVINCISDYPTALSNLLRCVNPDGYMLLWLYHTYGEYERLIDRQLALLILKTLHPSAASDQLSILRKLQLSLPSDQYGTMPIRQRIECNQASIDADAYLHPVVNTFTFGSITEILERSGAEWTAINGVNWRGQSKLLDLTGQAKDSYFMVQNVDLFSDPELQRVFESLTLTDKLSVIELRLKPTAFSVVAGKGKSYTHLMPRISGNLNRAGLANSDRGLSGGSAL